MKIKVIVNPHAGRRTVQKQLERIIGRLLLDGTASSVDVTLTSARGHATEVATALEPGQYDLLIGCGGDGTINEIINGLIIGGSGTRLAILAAGTSNDFAVSMKLPQTADDFCKMVKDGCYQKIDIGIANGRYFINVAAFGMFTEVAHSTKQTAKNNFGLLAYYLHGLREAPEHLSQLMPLSIRSAEYSAEGDYHVCLVVNSMSVASLRKLMYKADVSDGVFDVLLLKKKKLLPSPDTVRNSIFQLIEALSMPPDDDKADAIFPADPNEEDNSAFIYFQTSHIEFTPLQEAPIEVDLDGERYGQLPLTVDVAQQAVELLVPREPKPSINPLHLRG